jgi:hypothetical protein
MKESNRIGEMNYNTWGTAMVIVEYYNRNNIIIEFQDNYKYRTKTNYSIFHMGNVSNPYDKTVFGIGYKGIGKYNKSYDKKLYSTWYNMILRCYQQKELSKYKTYKGCSVDERFWCLQDFGKWYEENYYEVPNEIMSLDKDILIKGNRIYSPDSCVFTPQTINSLIVKKYNNGNDTLPLGVCYHKKHCKYMASCSTIDKKIVCLGYYDTPEEAFNVYKQFKEKYIKTVADKYKQFIPEKLYNALYTYTIEIDD